MKIKVATCLIVLFFVLLNACVSSTDVPVPTIKNVSSQTFTPTSPPTMTPSGTSTYTPAPTLTPSMTPPPCPAAPVSVGSMTLIFHKDVEPQDCERIARLVTMTMDWITEAGYRTGSAKMQVFGRLEEVAQYDYAKYQSQSGMSYAEVEAGWRDNPSAGAMPGEIIIYTGNWWKRTLEKERIKTVVHEMMHIVQYELYGNGKRGFSNVPIWLVEGQAEYLARLIESEWGIKPLDVQETLLIECRQFDLDDIAVYSDKNGNCIYVQGEQVFVLLAGLYSEKSFEVWRFLGEGNAFENAFKMVYGIDVAEFSDLFDQFSRTQYKNIPVLPTSTP